MRASTFGSTKRAPGMAEESIIGCHIPDRGMGTLSSNRSIKRVAGDPLRLRVEVGQDAVPQDRVGERANVIEATW